MSMSIRSNHTRLLHEHNTRNNRNRHRLAVYTTTTDRQITLENMQNRYRSSIPSEVAIFLLAARLITGEVSELNRHHILFGFSPQLGFSPQPLFQGDRSFFENPETHLPTFIIPNPMNPENCVSMQNPYVLTTPLTLQEGFRVCCHLSGMMVLDLFKNL